MVAVTIWAVIATALLCVAVYYCIKFATIIIGLQDKLENALDILDQKYQTFSEIAEKPVFFDSVEVRQVIFEIDSTRQMILYIANNLSNLESLDFDTFKSNKEEG